MLLLLVYRIIKTKEVCCNENGTIYVKDGCLKLPKLRLVKIRLEETGKNMNDQPKQTECYYKFGCFQYTDKKQIEICLDNSEVI